MSVAGDSIVSKLLDLATVKIEEQREEIYRLTAKDLAA